MKELYKILIPTVNYFFTNLSFYHEYSRAVSQDNLERLKYKI
jgi:hypothetical protein